jgi:hypothetical protein
MDQDEQTEGEQAVSGLALVPDGGDDGGDHDLPPIDIDESFTSAFAQHCRITGGEAGDSDLVSLTVAELTLLGENMFYAGYSAALRDLGH